jgi:hypothetical protein
MLISAAVGAGTGAAGAAVSGGDPLKGALLGGATGAITGGAMGAFSGGAGAAGSVAGSATEAAAAEAAKTAATTGTTAATTSVPGAIPGYAAAAPAVAPPVPGPGSVPGAIPGYSAAAPAVTPPPTPTPANAFGVSNLTNTQLGTVGAGTALQSMMAADRNRYGVPPQQSYNGPLSKFSYDPNTYKPQPHPTERYAEGGIAALANGDLGGNMNYPQAQINRTQYATPTQMPTSAQVMASGYEPKTNPYTGVESPIGMKSGGIAGLLKGQGDGMSDSINATIANKQPARLADGEFVVPADVVSHLGNGSTDAGAKHLYSMMDKVRSARTGTKKQGRQIKAGGYLPA